MMLLDAAGLDEVEIIAAVVDYMSDFHRLITEMSGPAMNSLCSEFAGLYRYAKIGAPPSGNSGALRIAYD
jgi:hypothetical protein